MPAGRMKSKNISSKHSNIATYPRQPANTVRVAVTWRRAFWVWGLQAAGVPLDPQQRKHK